MTLRTDVLPPRALYRIARRSSWRICPQALLAAAGVLVMLWLAPSAASAQTPAPTTGVLVSGRVPSDGGFGLIVFGGGTFQQLIAASTCSSAQVTFWASNPSGDFDVFVPGTSIAVVNAAWNARFPSNLLPPNTPLLARCTTRLVSAGWPDGAFSVTNASLTDSEPDLLGHRDRVVQFTVTNLSSTAIDAVEVQICTFALVPFSGRLIPGPLPAGGNCIASFTDSTHVEAGAQKVFISTLDPLQGGARTVDVVPLRSHVVGGGVWISSVLTRLCQQAPC